MARASASGQQMGAAAAFAAGQTRTALGTDLPACFAAGLLCLIAALLMGTISRPKAAA